MIHFLLEDESPFCERFGKYPFSFKNNKNEQPINSILRILLSVFTMWEKNKNDGNDNINERVYGYFDFYEKMYEKKIYSFDELNQILARTCLINKNL